MRKGIMLCYTFEPKRLWIPPYICQHKLDGDRCRAILDNEGKVTLLSSQENVITSIPHINSQLEKTGLTNLEFDGELCILGEHHSVIHGIVSRKVNPHSDYLRIKYHIFDIVEPKKTMVERVKVLDRIAMYYIRTDTCPNIIIEEPFLTWHVSDIFHFCNKFKEKGYEGVIIRNKDAFYERKKSTNIMKLKPPKIKVKCPILWYEEEISIDGIPKDTLGSLVCSLNLKDIKFNVGTGPYLTKEKRQQLWDDRSNLINKIATVGYQELTKKGKPRFPVLIDIT